MEKFDVENLILDKDNASFMLKNRVVYKVIDELWLSTIESVLPSLDKCIRKPTRYIEETDRVLPIEQSRNITARSIRDLAAHSNYIKETDEGEIMPSKILNVFRDETIQTYENRFINTLIQRLFLFVDKRFKDANLMTVDSDSKILDIESVLNINGTSCKAKINIELDGLMNGQNGDGSNGTRIEDRVRRIHDIAMAYSRSPFCKEMGTNYVRPPIMRTNALLKNPDLRQCLALWEFIEGYNEVGYEAIVKESDQVISEEMTQKMLDTIATQCATFYSLVNDKTQEENEVVTEEVKPSLIKDNKEQNVDLFDLRDTIYKNILEVVEQYKPNDDLEENLEKQEQISGAVSLAVEKGLLEEDEYFKKLFREKITIPEGRLNKSFKAKLIQSERKIQEFYSEIKNYLLSFKKVKCRESWKYESFNLGRKKLARITIIGKTLTLNLALNPNDFDTNIYHHKDTSHIKSLVEIPLRIKIRSARAVKKAKQLIDAMALNENLIFTTLQTVSYLFDYENNTTLISKGLIKLKKGATGDLSIDGELMQNDTQDVDGESEDEENGVNTILSRYNRSFKAKLIQSDSTVQDFYGEIKNYLLSFKKVKCRESWKYESFNLGRKKLARITIIGKTLTLNLALNPNDFDTNIYHHKDTSHIKSLVEIPLRIKIRSARAVKKAKQLIDAMALNENLIFTTLQTVDYSLAYLDTETLIGQGLIKVRDGEVGAVDFNGGENALDGENQTEKQAQKTDGELMQNDTQDVDGESEDQDDQTEENGGEESFGQGNGVFGFNGKNAVRYKRSNLSRIIQLEDYKKCYYNDLKNELLSYKKINCRMSHGAETFTFHRLKVAKIIVRGKSLYLYLALNPSEFEQSKYHQKDASNKKSLAQTPFAIKVSSDRSYSYANQLIAVVMENVGTKKGNRPRQNYLYVYQTDEQLLANGLIKLVGEQDENVIENVDVQDVQTDIQLEDQNSQVENLDTQIEENNDQILQEQVERNDDVEVEDNNDQTSQSQIEENAQTENQDQTEIKAEDNAQSNGESNLQGGQNGGQFTPKHGILYIDEGEVEPLTEEERKQALGQTEDGEKHADQEIKEDGESQDNSGESQEVQEKDGGENDKDGNDEEWTEVAPALDKKELDKVFFDFKTNITQYSEVFSRYDKNEVISVINKIRSNTATSVIDQVESEVLVAYQSLLKLGFYKRNQLHKMLIGNNINDTVKAKDKLIELYFKKIKGKNK